MKNWLRLLVGVAGISLIWVVAWGAAGALIGIVVSSASLNRLWLGPPIGVHPGFVGGVIFAAALGIAARPRRLHDVSFSMVIVCGGLVGLLLGVLPLAINKPPRGSPLWLVAAVVLGSMTLMSALSAAGSLALVRWAGQTPMKQRELRHHSPPLH